jgi:hypothetical protein
LNGCLARAPDALWPHVAAALESTRDGRPNFSLAMALRSRNFPESLLAPRIVAWARAGDSSRRHVAAYLATAPRDAPESLGTALLDAFPAERQIEAALASTFWSGVHGGPWEKWEEAKLQELSALRQSARRGLSTWARRLLPEARERVKVARKEDQRWELDH